MTAVQLVVRPSRLTPLTMAAIVLAACATLPSVPEGECGNGILEGDEDCEPLEAGGILAASGTPTTSPALRCPKTGATACRFTCKPLSADQLGACPPGYGCGTDAVCRRPSGSLVDTPATVGFEATALSAGDVNGDGQHDVVATGRATVTSFEWDPAGGVLRPLVRIGSRTTPPAVGSFASAGLADLAMVREGGLLSVFRGDKTRPLEPQFYSAFPGTGSELRLVLADALPPSGLSYRGTEVFVHRTGDDNLLTRLIYLPSPNERETVLTLPVKPSELLGIAVGRFHDTVGLTAPLAAKVPPCDTMVFPKVGAVELPLFDTCVRDGSGQVFVNKLPEAPSSYELLPKVALAAGYVVGPGGVRLFDLDDDGHLDVIVDGQKIGGAASERAALVAYGRGDRHFHGTAGATGPADDTALPEPDADCGGAFPLLYAHLTDDREVDCVAPARVLYRRVGATLELLAGRYDSDGFREALVADFNGDGRADIATLSLGAIDVMLGTGTYANRRSYAAAAPRLGAAADVDGDSIPDVAFVSEVDTELTLQLLMGQARGFPELPLSLGRRRGVEQIVVAPISQDVGGRDEVSEIGVVSKVQGVPSVALVRGNTSREFDAPFAVAVASQGPILPAVASSVVAGLFSSNAGGRSELGIIADARRAVSDLPDHRLFFVAFGEGATVNPFVADGSGGAKTAMEASDPLEPTFDWTRARLAASPTAKNSELYALVPSRTAGQPPGLFAATLGPGNRFTVRAVLTSAGQSPGEPGRAGELVLDDFNGDGHGDVAVWVRDGSKPRVLVALGPAPATASAFAEVDLGGATATAIGAVELDGKPGRELVVATNAGVSRIVFEPGPRLADPPLLPDAPPASAALGADVDGDGVEDLVLAAGGSLEVHRGRALRQ